MGLDRRIWLVCWRNASWNLFVSLSPVFLVWASLPHPVCFKTNPQLGDLRFLSAWNSSSGAWSSSTWAAQPVEILLAHLSPLCRSIVIALLADLHLYIAFAAQQMNGDFKVFILCPFRPLTPAWKMTVLINTSDDHAKGQGGTRIVLDECCYFCSG